MFAVHFRTVFLCTLQLIVSPKTCLEMLFWYNGPLLSKSKRILFGMLHVVHVASDGPLVLDQCDLSERDFMASHLGAGLLFLLAWLKRDGLQSAFTWLTRHKRLLAWAVVFQLVVHGLCGALDPVRMLRLFSRGIWSSWKQCFHHQLPQSQSQ